ncbi:MAG TPA: tRNA (N6-isopentenyl adenosine(37)-C2)-methylthiotransferase MiaB [Pantanalinema sp.]
MTPADAQETTATKRVYIKTHGCQMNMSDSEKVIGMLAAEGYRLTDEETEADLLVVNTCSIREKAEDKLFSLLGVWKDRKKANPDVQIAVMGCVAQQEKDRIRERVPLVDVVVGTHNYHELPELLEEARIKGPITRIGNLKAPIPDDLPTVREGKFHAWVPIIHGCSYFCTYCIVPYTRGPYQSRKPEAIEKEVRELVDEGFKEFTLLGQTVDRYGMELQGDEKTTLGGLLRRLSAVPGVERIRFLTSHPLDMTEELVETVAALPNVMEYFHFPIQAGSDRVLAEMKRGYTVAEYLEKVALIRKHIPDAVISGDLIVGFPGETEEDFQGTLEVVDRVEFDSNNTASYSVRQWTPAGKRDDQLGEEVKADRLQRLNEKVAEVAYRRNRRMVGTVQEVLVEGPSSKNPEVFQGRTRGNKICYFPGDASLEGQIVKVQVTEARPFTLRGEIVKSIVPLQMA